MQKWGNFEKRLKNHSQNGENFKYIFMSFFSSSFGKNKVLIQNFIWEIWFLSQKYADKWDLKR